jgi:hypothetical protein
MAISSDDVFESIWIFRILSLEYTFMLTKGIYRGGRSNLTYWIIKYLRGLLFQKFLFSLRALSGCVSGESHMRETRLRQARAKFNSFEQLPWLLRIYSFRLTSSSGFTAWACSFLHLFSVEGCFGQQLLSVMRHCWSLRKTCFFGRQFNISLKFHTHALKRFISIQSDVSTLLVFLKIDLLYFWLCRQRAYFCYEIAHN